MQQDVNALLQSIYEEYQAGLRRLACMLGVPEADIDDVVQETFISYFEKYSLYWSAKCRKAMLVKILKNKCIDYFRKSSRDREAASSFEENSDQEIQIMSRPETDPLALLIGKEAFCEITEDILSMRPEWREVAVLYFMEEKSIQEICDMLGIPGTVCRSRIYRTRNYLKKVLGPRYHFQV